MIFQKTSLFFLSQAWALTLFCSPSFSAFPSPDRCLAGVLGFAEDTEAPFAEHWNRQDKFFEQFVTFDRILMLSDGADLEDSIRVADYFPSKVVTGSDRQVRASLGLPKNLIAVSVDNSHPRLPFPDGAFDLVFLQCGLCHCRDPARACCGVKRTDSDISRFIGEVVRVLDPARSDSLALLHGLMEPAVFVKWFAQCKKVASSQGLRCVPQIYFDTGYPSPFWGFKIRK